MIVFLGELFFVFPSDALLSVLLLVYGIDANFC